MSRLSLFVDFYVKGKYHCDSCPYCWGGGYNAGCDDYDDCGCYIKGDIYDTCRLLPPIRFMLGYFRKKKAEYHFNHEHDGCGDFFEREQEVENEFERLLKGFIGDYELCYKNGKGDLIPIDTAFHIKNEAWRFRSEYDDFAHPTERISLKTQWRNIIKNTGKAITGKIKPYFCK
ncbi:MAG: hypothetical protein RR162_00165 [Oscillospiraceae bacterium]